MSLEQASLDGGYPLETEFIIDLRDTQLLPAVEFIMHEKFIRSGEPDIEHEKSKYQPTEGGATYYNLKAKVYELEGQRCWWAELSIKTLVEEELRQAMVQAAKDIPDLPANIPGWKTERFSFYDDYEIVPVFVEEMYELGWHGEYPFWTSAEMPDKTFIEDVSQQSDSRESEHMVEAVEEAEDIIGQLFTVDDWVKVRNALITMGANVSVFI